MRLFTELLKTDPARIAILGAVVGGCFALFNQIVNRTWDSACNALSSSRKLSGLLLAALTEALHNTNTLASLVYSIRLARNKRLDGVWQDDPHFVVLRLWSTEHEIWTEAFTRFFYSDLASECADGALALLPTILEQIRSTVQLLSKETSSDRLMPPDLDMLEACAIREFRMLASIILDVVFQNRRLRRSAFARKALVQMCGLQYFGITLEGKVYSKRQRLWLSRQVDIMHTWHSDDVEFFNNARATLNL